MTVFRDFIRRRLAVLHIRLLYQIASFAEPLHLGTYWYLMKSISRKNSRCSTDANEKAFVHVHMTAFNAEKTIEQAIRSVMNQSHQNWNLVIIDDCSSDQTPQIIRSFQDSRITYFVRTENQRQWANRNMAISIGLKQSSKPDFFTSIDADDIAKPNWLSNSLELFATDSIIGIRPLIERVHYTTLQPLWSAPACQQTMWRREVFETIGGYRTDIAASDSDFMNRARRLAIVNRQQILVSTEKLQLMRNQPNSWSKQYTHKDKLFKDYSRSSNNGLFVPLECQN